MANCAILVREGFGLRLVMIEQWGELDQEGADRRTILGLPRLGHEVINLGGDSPCDLLELIGLIECEARLVISLRL